MTQSAYTLRPSLRSALLAFLVHHNPFYLLSALCMLAGCYALNSGLAARTGELHKLLTLLGVLNAYEAILIGLAIYLIKRRGILRDGRTLLLLEAPFLVDLAFINAEVGSNSVRVGGLLDLAILMLALIKTAIVLRALWGRLPGRLYASIAIQLAVLFLLPGVLARFDHHQHGDVTPGEFYAAWWLVGVMMIAAELQARFFGPADEMEGDVRRFVRRLYVALPLASVILHLCLLQWVYRVPLVSGDVGPVLIGAAFVMGRWSRVDRPEVRWLRGMMPLAAVVLTAENPPGWTASIGGVRLTPTLLLVGAAYVTYVYCFFFRRALRLLGGATLGLVIVLFGPTWDQLWLAWLWASHRVMTAARWLGGRSAIEWGLAAMGASFGFLALGAGISLRREAPPAEPGA